LVKFPVMKVAKKKKMVDEAKWRYLLHWCVPVWPMADIAAGPAEPLKLHLHLPMTLPGRPRHACAISSRLVLVAHLINQ
jgi:hypothetical protein